MEQEKAARYDRRKVLTVVAKLVAITPVAIIRTYIATASTITQKSLFAIRRATSIENRVRPVKIPKLVATNYRLFRTKVTSRLTSLLLEAELHPDTTNVVFVSQGGSGMVRKDRAKEGVVGFAPAFLLDANGLQLEFVAAMTGISVYRNATDQLFALCTQFNQDQLADDFDVAGVFWVVSPDITRVGFVSSKGEVIFDRLGPIHDVVEISSDMKSSVNPIGKIQIGNGEGVYAFEARLGTWDYELVNVAMELVTLPNGFTYQPMRLGSREGFEGLQTDEDRRIRPGALQNMANVSIPMAVLSVVFAGPLVSTREGDLHIPVFVLGASGEVVRLFVEIPAGSAPTVVITLGKLTRPFPTFSKRSGAEIIHLPAAKFGASPLVQELVGRQAMVYLFLSPIQKSAASNPDDKLVNWTVKGAITNQGLAAGEFREGDVVRTWQFFF